MNNLTIDNNLLFKIRNKSVKDGLPIVFLHGSWCDGAVWLTLSRLLAKALPTRKSYLMNLPGRGKNRGNNFISVEYFAETVIRFIQDLQIEKVVLVGHSMGGAVAQTVAANAPREVAGLVLLASGLKFEIAAELSAEIERDFENAIQKMTRLILSPQTPRTLISVSEKQMRTIGKDTAQSDFLTCASFDFENRVNEISTPSIVCVGSLDRLTPPEQNRLLAHKLKGNFFEIEKAGHMLHIEAADRLTPIIADFIERL